MSQLDWDSLTEEEKQKVQAYVLSQSVEGNPDLPSSALSSENMSLDTEDKTVIGAINELNHKASAAYNGTENFNARFNTIIGDETDSDKEAWLKIKEFLGGNLLKAVLQAKDSIIEVDNSLTQMNTTLEDVQTIVNKKTTVVPGSVSVAELAKMMGKN